MSDKPHAAARLRLVVDNDDVRLDATDQLWERIPPTVSLSLLPMAAKGRRDGNSVSIVSMASSACPQLVRKTLTLA